MSSAESPIRYPDASSPEAMTRRAWVLLILNLLVPGSAQALAGNRQLGRVGLRATLVLWGTLLLGALFMGLWQAFTLTLVTSTWFLWVVTVVAIGYAVLWFVLTLDTLRLLRLVTTGPRARWILAGVTALSLVASTGVAVYASQLSVSTNSLLTNVFRSGPAEPPINGRYNFLLLGGDAGPDRDGLRPDSAMVVSVDAETGATVTIGMPRDLHDFTFPAGSVMAGLYPEGYTESSADYCGEWACLNTVYVDAEENHRDAFAASIAKGIPAGVAAMMEAASGVTGLTVQYYALIDMQGFSDLVDALGGVDVCVENRVPIVADETSEPQHWIEEGCQRLNGHDALWFARARYQIGDGDYGRMQRQAKLEQAIVEQFTPATILAKFNSIAASTSEIVTTSVPQSMLGYFVTLAEKARAIPIARVELIPANGVDPQEPDYAYIASLIEQALHPATESHPPASG
ncbi:MAG TPA: LCP family protein [Microbacteriaceae bacterium]|nr:LCP family protein [Microbacteriaceae bacterium]